MPLIILLHISYLGMGIFILRTLFASRDYAWSFRFILAYYVGILTHIVILHIAIIFTITSPIVTWMLLCVGLLGLSIEATNNITVTPYKIESLLRQYKIRLLATVMAVIFLAPIIYLITLRLASVPDISFDSTAFWNLKAKYFFYGQHLWTDTFLDVNRINEHRDYPLYMPMFNFEHYSIIGKADDFVAKVGTLIYYGAGLILFFCLVGEWAGNKVALLTTSFVLYSPAYSYDPYASITSTYVDFPLSLMILISTSFLLRYLRSGNTIDYFGAAAAASSAALQKTEGTVWAVLFIAVTPLIMFMNRGKISKNDYAWVLLPICILGGWYLIKSRLPYGLDIVRPSIDELLKLWTVAPKMLFAWFASLFKIEPWGLLPFFTIPAFMTGLIRNTHKKIMLVPAVMVLCYLASNFIAFMLLDIQIGRFDYYMRVSYDRHIIHILLVSIFLAVAMNTAQFAEAVDS
jgi:hypothetical protein